MRIININTCRFASEKGTIAEVQGRQLLKEMEEGIVGDGTPNEGTVEGSTGKDTGAESEEGESSAEVVKPVIARDPMMPTSRQRAMHDILHIRFREWYADCVQGRGKDRYHLRLIDESNVPIIGMDYMFITERGVTHDSGTADEWSNNGECIAVLVMKDFLHKSIWAYPVEAKGY